MFVGVDLDRIYNAYIDPQAITVFLLQVLQKHLGYTIKPMMNASFSDAYSYFRKSLFEDSEALADLIRASAGVPRDFLRIFSSAFQVSSEIPISKKNIRRATHEFFNSEKRTLIQGRVEVNDLFDSIYREICLPAKTYMFFVSRQHTGNRILQEIWHHRLIHLIFEGITAFASGKPGTFDAYVIDYGNYILMRSGDAGEAFFKVMQTAVIKLVVAFRLGGNAGHLQSLLPAPTNPKIKEDLGYLFSQNIEIGSPDLERLLDEVSSLVADRIISKYNG